MTREFTEIVPPEELRVYVYPNNEQLRFENVVSISISESGNHYINTADGTKAIVTPGWRAILLSIKDWTF